MALVLLIFTYVGEFTYVTWKYLAMHLVETIVYAVLFGNDRQTTGVIESGNIHAIHLILAALVVIDPSTGGY
jgi:hypothetical protein